jgi:hypothetical protein
MSPKSLAIASLASSVNSTLLTELSTGKGVWLAHPKTALMRANDSFNRLRRSVISANPLGPLIYAYADSNNASTSASR